MNRWYEERIHELQKTEVRLERELLDLREFLKCVKLFAETDTLTNSFLIKKIKELLDESKV